MVCVTRTGPGRRTRFSLIRTLESVNFVGAATPFRRRHRSASHPVRTLIRAPPGRPDARMPGAHSAPSPPDSTGRLTIQVLSSGRRPRSKGGQRVPETQAHRPPAAASRRHQRGRPVLPRRRSGTRAHRPFQPTRDRGGPRFRFPSGPRSGPSHDPPRDTTAQAADRTHRAARAARRPPGPDARHAERQRTAPAPAPAQTKDPRVRAEARRRRARGELVSETTANSPATASSSSTCRSTNGSIRTRNTRSRW